MKKKDLKYWQGNLDYFFELVCENVQPQPITTHENQLVFETFKKQIQVFK